MAKTPNDDEQGKPRQPVQPTEQIPPASTPVSAKAAASGGATGLDSADLNGADADGGRPDGGDHNGTDSATATPRENENIFRRHPLGAGIAAGVVAVILVSGLTAWGVGSAVTASLASNNNNNSQLATVPSSSPTAGTGPGAAGNVAGGRLAFRATIQSISGSNWTILTKKGKTVTIAVDSATQFGTKRMSETSSSFTIGDSVIIVATKRGETATATRVVSASDVGKGAGTMAPMPTPTSSAST